MTTTEPRPDIVVVMTDEERAVPSYEPESLRAWRERTLTGRRWFDEHGVSFTRHYTGSLACVPSRPTIFTGQYPDLHGVTQTDGLGKTADDSRMRWLPPYEVPTLGNWFEEAGYDTHYVGKWHISHADLVDPETGWPARHQHRQRPRPARRRRGLPRGRPAGALRLPRLDRARAPWRAAGERRHRAGPAHRRPGRGVARGPLRAPPGRRRGRPAAVPARRQLREPPRHRAVPGLGPAQPARAVTARPPGRARRAHRRRGPLHQAGGPDRVPGRLPDRLRPAARGADGLPAQRPAVPQPVPAAARGGRRPARPGPPSRHRGRLRGGAARAHLRPRRAAGRARGAPPEVVHPLRRGDPGALHHRAHRVPPDHRPGRRRRTDLARRRRPDAALRRRDRRGGRGGPPGRALRRGPPPSRPGPATGRGRRGGARPLPSRLPHDPRQHARGRHRRVGPGPPDRPGGRPPAAAADPGPGPRGVELREHRGARRRRPGALGRSRPPLEAGPHLRRPGDLDRAGRAAPRRRRTGRPAVPHRPPARPVGALRPRRRSDRGANRADDPDLAELRSHLERVLAGRADPGRPRPERAVALRGAPQPPRTPPGPAPGPPRPACPAAPRPAPRRRGALRGRRARDGGPWSSPPTTGGSTSASPPGCSPAS